MTLHEMEVAELSPSQRQHYDKCLASGSTPKMALMLASKQAALMGGSDRAFNEGARRKMSNLPHMNQTMLSIARKAGINTSGKYHVAGLGKYNNPLAWVSTVDDVRESLKLQGLSSQGLVKYQAPEKPPLPDIPLAPDIVDAEVARRLSGEGTTRAVLPSDPKKRASALADLREQVVAEHGPQRRKRGRAGSPGESLLAALAGKNR